MIFQNKYCSTSARRHNKALIIDSITCFHMFHFFDLGSRASIIRGIAHIDDNLFEFRDIGEIMKRLLITITGFPHQKVAKVNLLYMTNTFTFTTTYTLAKVFHFVGRK